LIVVVVRRDAYFVLPRLRSPIRHAEGRRDKRHGCAITDRAPLRTDEWIDKRDRIAICSKRSSRKHANAEKTNGKPVHDRQYSDASEAAANIPAHFGTLRK
jgi:hypothetical protein